MKIALSVPIASIAALALASSCASEPPLKAPSATTPHVTLAPLKPVAEEQHLTEVKQVTLAGENAEAYWSWSGRELILQSRTGDNDCDRIYRMPLSVIFNNAAGS